MLALSSDILSFNCINVLHVLFIIIQLHVYPGYEPDEVTPLPEPLQAKEILLTVINAQQDLWKKVTNYKLDQIKQSDITYTV